VRYQFDDYAELRVSSHDEQVSEINFILLGPDLNKEVKKKNLV
jgi:hypothetical protein